MDVFVIPIDDERYELYCELPVEADPDASPASGRPGRTWYGKVTQLLQRWQLGWLAEFLERWRLRFVNALNAAERGELQERSRDGWLGRLQVRVTAWLAERIAEQRLLWRLRNERQAVAVHPQDMTFEQVRTLVMRILQRDHDRHRRWLIVDAVGMILSWPLVLVPGPNLLLYYFMVRVGGHWFSMNGARQGLRHVAWSGQPCASLGELRGAASLDPATRERRVRDVAAHLRLQHLSRFFERVAVRHA